MTALLWEDACASTEPTEDIWPEGPAQQLVESILSWARYGFSDMPEVSVLREEQLGEAGRVWARSNSSPTVMLCRLTILAEILLHMNQVRQLFVEQAVRMVVVAAADETFRQLTGDELQDRLTGVGNRRALESALEHDLARVRRHHGDLSVVIVELDGLTEINEELGHADGDRALQSLVEILEFDLRAEDRIFRVTGEKFVLLLADTAPEAVSAIMDRMSDAGAPTFSWGVASIPDGGADARVLLKDAERHLHARRWASWAPMSARPERTAGSHFGHHVFVPLGSVFGLRATQTIAQLSADANHRSVR